MLQSQVNYWNLQEQIRHNKETEAAAFEQAAASKMSANASRVQAEVAQSLVPFEQMKAQASTTQAQASIMQAEAALQNAETNRGNLDVNRINAATNQRNAEINQQNADINAWNAAINQQNANTNAFNADTNRMIGESTVEKNRVDNFGTIVQSGLNAWRTETEKELLKQEQQKTPFVTANEIVNLAKGGTQAVSNIAGAANDTINTIHNVISSHKTPSSSTHGNGIVSNQLKIVSNALPIIMKVIK